MKRITKYVVIFVGILALLSMKNTGKDFQVYIEQNGKIIKAENNELTLKKKTFDIVFEFSEPMGVLINASFNPETYESAKNSIVKAELPGFINTGMAEHLQNPDNEILITYNAPSYWFYQDEQKHRFNSVEYKNRKYICRRTIEQLNNIDSDEITKIQDVEKPLYLVFIYSEYNNDYSEEYELRREMMKINWK